MPIDVRLVQPDPFRFILDRDEYNRILSKRLPASQDERRLHSLQPI